jgi:hypothetical protein
MRRPTDSEMRWSVLILVKPLGLIALVILATVLILEFVK